MTIIQVHAQAVMYKCDEQKSKDFQRNIVKNPSGIYHLGCSDDEWTLLILSIDGKYIVQKQWGAWATNKDGANIWAKKFQTFENCTLTNGQIVGTEFKTEFALSPDNKQGIIIASKNLSEFGVQSSAETIHWAGKYPQTSMRLLTKSDLEGLPAKELQIMRNEIYARYQFIFAKGGEMEKYFQAQDWYVAVYKDVNKFLTSIEQENIKMIQKYEALAK
jgi:hypothetical protein